MKHLRTLALLLISLFFLGQAASARADCIQDWLTQNPPMGNLSAEQLTDFNLLSDWIEQVLPDFFPPPGLSGGAGPIAFRFYDETAAFFGVLNSFEDKIFYLGPLTGYCFLDLGSLGQWMESVPTPDDPDDPDEPGEPISGEVIGMINEDAYDASQSTTTVSISRMCESLEDFLALQSQIAHTPQGAVAMMIQAMAIYQQDPVVGRQCLTAASTDPLTSPSTAEGSYNGYIITNVSRMAENIARQPTMPYIYYQGASPENGYQPDGPPYELNMSTNPYSYNAGGDGLVRIKLFVETLGADSARPAQAKKVGNIYKVTEFSSLYLGHR
jgi:hypothetical protein